MSRRAPNTPAGTLLPWWASLVTLPARACLCVLLVVCRTHRETPT